MNKIGWRQPSEKVAINLHVCAGLDSNRTFDRKYLFSLIESPITVFLLTNLNEYTHPTLQLKYKMRGVRISISTNALNISPLNSSSSEFLLFNVSISRSLVLSAQISQRAFSHNIESQVPLFAPYFEYPHSLSS